MKRKTTKKFIYKGLGFPIELHHVEMVKVDREWHPKIDIRRVADSAIKELSFQKERLTGDQIKFIRTYFEMSLREFGKKVVHESHMAVSKWEQFKNKPTNMDINIEVMLKLYIYEKTCIKNLAQTKRFFEKYLIIRKINFTRNPPCIILKVSS